MTSVWGGAVLKIVEPNYTDSIAGLKLVDKTTTNVVLVTGYYAAGDGGGGVYYYDAADTVSTDNKGSIIVANDGGRWKLAQPYKWSVKQFGCKGSNTDDTTYFQAANDAAYAATNIRSLFIPSGQYQISTEVTNQGVSWEGEPASMNGNGSRLIWTGAGNTFINFTQYFEGQSFKDIDFDTSGVNTAVYANYWALGMHGIRYTNVRFKAYHTGASWGGTYAEHYGIYVVGGVGAAKYDCSNNVLDHVVFQRTKYGFTVSGDPALGGPGNANEFRNCFYWGSGWFCRMYGSDNLFSTCETNSEAGSHAYYLSGQFAFDWKLLVCNYQPGNNADGNQIAYSDTAGAVHCVDFDGGYLSLAADASGYANVFKDAGATGGKAFRFRAYGVNNYNSTTLLVDDMQLGLGMYTWNRGTYDGSWNAPGFNAADFSGNGAMTVTVTAPEVTDYSYTLIGKTCTIKFTIGNFTIGGTPDVQVMIKMPAGVTSNSRTYSVVTIKNNGVWGVGLATTAPGGDNQVRIYCDVTGGTNWTASANTAVQGEITFEIV